MMSNKPISEHAWVEQTLQSLEGTARPVPSPWLHQLVGHRLAARQTAALAEAPGLGWILTRVAVVAVLVLANLVTFAHHDDFGRGKDPSPIAAEYAYPTLTDVN
ncbi:hypothetical protein [Hymenobacter negativus]|uniref:Uncharacterized protein n=1 Tax=Hymenobacter negativus TaxID=2795026 RepID=A0ABS3QCT7_9BACT|nr:hypothetical protein [Hymenobacter negativus]MBO2009057.1 hypothetical protein [Hymenobacter negativus]